MRLTLNYSVCNFCNFCMYLSLWCKQFYLQYHKNISSATENLLYLDRVFLKSKKFPFRHNRNFCPKVITLFLIKLSVYVSDSSFLLHFLSKAKIFSGNNFLFFSRFWNIRFSDRYHFYISWQSSYLKTKGFIVKQMKNFQTENAEAISRTNYWQKELVYPFCLPTPRHRSTVLWIKYLANMTKLSQQVT